MRAVVCRAYGPPEDLVLADVDEPVAGPGQLLVRVHAAAVNFPDVLFVAGKYQVRIPPPFIPGNEVAVDLAVAMKARVLAAASSPEKLDLCRQRGAEATVDYDREDLKSRIRELTGDSARVVLDPVGGAYSEPALRGLARGGTFVTLGYAAGTIPAIPLNLVLLKDITIRGMEIRTFMADHPDQAIRDTEELTE